MPQPSILSRMVIVCAVGLLLGIGLCGLDYFLASRGIGKSTEEFSVGPLDSVSILTMILSALGLVFTALAWGVSQVFRAISSRHRHEDHDE